MSTSKSGDTSVAGELKNFVDLIMKSSEYVESIVSKTKEVLAPLADKITEFSKGELEKRNKSPTLGNPEEKYYSREVFMSRLFQDLNLSGYQSHVLNSIWGKLNDKGIPLHTKRYNEIFLPSLGLNKEKIETGDISLREIREIFRDCLLSEDRRLELQTTEPFDSSDFLDWSIDGPLYDKYKIYTYTAYGNMITGKFNRDELRFTMKTLYRFRAYLRVGFSEDNVEEILDRMTSFMSTKPKKLSEVRNSLGEIDAISPIYREFSISDTIRKSTSKLFPVAQKELDCDFWENLSRDFDA